MTGSTQSVPGRAMNRLGFWAAIGACVASIAYDVPQLLQVAGLLPDPIDRILIFAPSLVLAPFFVVAISAAYGGAPARARPWRLAALCLALLYAAMASIVYSNQLTVVIPAQLRGAGQAVAAFACCGVQMPMTALDLLGYTYMSLSLLLLAPSYDGRALRWLLVANGLLAPAIFLQFLWPALIYLAAAWIVLFPAAMAPLALDMSRSNRRAGKA
jgi:hypothetical protein